MEKSRSLNQLTQLPFTRKKRVPLRVPLRGGAEHRYLDSLEGRSNSQHENQLMNASPMKNT